jgi:acrosin
MRLDTYSASGGLFGRIAGFSNERGSISYNAATTASPIPIAFGSGGNNITIADTTVNAIILSTGTGTDTVSVQATHAPLTIHGQAGNDTVTVGNAGNAQGVTALITIDNALANTDVIVDDAADTTPRSATLDSFLPTGASSPFGRVVGLAGAEIDFRWLDTHFLTLNSGQVADTIAVASTGASTFLNTGGGNDTVTVASQTSNLDDIPSPVIVDGGADANTLLVNDQSNPNPSVWEVTAAKVDRTAYPAGSVIVRHAGVDYSNIQTLTVNAGSGDDTINVRGTSAATTVNAGPGFNGVYAGNRANSLDDIQGALSVPADVAPALGVTYLVVHDEGATASGLIYTLTADALNRTGAAPISYGTGYSLTLYGGAGSDTYSVRGTKAGSTLIQTGASADQVDLYGNASNVNLFVYAGAGDQAVMGDGTVAALGGSIFLPSTFSHLTIDDRNDPSSRNITIRDYSISGLAPASLDFAPLALDFYLGTGGTTGNDVDVIGSGVFGQLTIHGNTGADRVKVEIGKDIYTHTVRFEGQGDDTLTIDDSARTGNSLYALTDSSVARTSPVLTTVQYTGVGSAKLIGGQGDDLFKVSGTPPGIPLTLDGGGGNNTLDYSAYPSADGHTGVVVNLATGQATGFAQISGIRNVIGSAFDDVLTGDGSANLLLGGKGADQLDGGDGGDILIGGSSTWYNAAGGAALAGFMAEWLRTDVSFDTRIDHLRNGGGLNGVYRLNAATILDDGAADTLTGGAGQDWFWINLTQDTANKQSDDRLN